MKQKSRELFTGLESELRAIEDLWRHEPAEQLRLKPGPERWSPIEAASHVMQSESQTLQYIRKKIQAGEAGLTQVNEDTHKRFAQLIHALDSGKKFAVPLPQLSPPAALPEQENLLSEWKSIRREWAEMIEAFPDSLMNREVFRHPIAGMLSFEQTLGFFLSHFRHHIHQLIPPKYQGTM